MTKGSHVLVALACGFESAAVLYALIRIAQALFTNEPNPAVAMSSIHAGYFWRAWIAAYGGGFVALVVAVVGHPTERAVRVATRALPFAGGLLAAQALLVP